MQQPSTRPPADALRGLPFTKMTGSGNDFVVFDAREVPIELVTRPEVIMAICDRHNGIGADGVVVLEPSPVTAAGGPAAPSPIRLRYFNRDGTLGELCGNATLCSTALAATLGLAPSGAVELLTDAGRVTARQVGGEPEIDVAPPTAVELDLSARIPLGPGEQRIGFATVGVPHVVVQLPDPDALERIDPVGAGRPIRQAEALRPAGANVNWIAPLPGGGWAYRTYERGVEDETLACGTGAIAATLLLTAWGLADGPVTLRTRSGRSVVVTLDRGAGALERARPSLRGEGRVVYRGWIDTLSVAG